ncbi:ELKS/Rab6-interacting/CAST family member 1-like isoform X9 [Cotesia glomerata]|uniref:ELKS/Rab6-interacting/CAST family member 1-like isoform X9 n=1 Tax=Cotesia glomerata TaxID=32391 RepID=UPI001D006C77|nr:ELKS/Rab6-interacting/CAST family member 1-like isoform X9 [Cotesia glomerata]
MNFLSNIADSIPVVGHVKGIVHYAVGDSEGGNKAMYQATRTSVVLGAGAAGSLAGPAGAAAAAMYAGALTDTVASVAMDEPQGLMKGCKNIAEDVKEGKNPMGSIASTGFQVAMDGVGGLGMGGVSSAASQVSEKAVAKGVENIAKNAVKNVGEKTIEQTMKMTGEQVVKKVTKTVTEKAVKKVIEKAVVQAEIALVTTHVCMQADERTKEEKRKSDREERDREERERQERRAREQQEQRAREERERRAREEREQEERRAREQQEQRTREQQEQRAREERERRAREEREQEERRAREQQEQRTREQQEQRAREERERQERRDREEREQQERRAREQQEQRTREQQEQRDREEREQQERRGREQQQRSNTPEKNSESTQPPRRNRGNRKGSRNDEPDYFAIFKNLLEELLNDIFGVERPYTRSRAYISQIFQQLSKGQINYLSDIIARLYKGEILEEVVRLVIRMFSEHFPEDISLLNFQSLMEFAAVYVQEEIDYRTEVYRSVEMIWRESDSSVVKMAAKDLKETIVSTIMNLADIVRMIVDIFESLKSGIESEPAANNLYPNFRNIFAAVYHYFKHRSVPGDGVLTIGEYYEWIRRVLEKLGGQQRYRDLVEAQTAGEVRANVKFEVYIVAFGRRIRIVVKFEGDTIILASCFFCNTTFDDDEEGMVWIVIRRF